MRQELGLTLPGAALSDCVRTRRAGARKPPTDEQAVHKPHAEDALAAAGRPVSINSRKD